MFVSAREDPSVNTEYSKPGIIASATLWWRGSAWAIELTGKSIQQLPYPLGGGDRTGKNVWRRLTSDGRYEVPIV